MAAADVLLVMVTISMMAATAVAAAAAKGKGFLDNYLVLGKKAATGQERLFCLARGRCRYKIIQCPRQCPHRKPPANNPKRKACFADCSSRYRLPNCNGYGSVCYDPRFVSGDGVMFYFHGAKGGDFALVSDDRFQINVHFIGTRPAGRARDFTWVQALALMFDSHTLVVAAKKVAVWDDSIDALAVSWDGQDITIDPPSTDGEAEWQADITKEITEDKSQKTKVAVVVVVIERTATTNSIRVAVNGMLEMDVKAVLITAEDDRKHGYRISTGDAFAHLKMQLKFAGLMDKVEGILGQTYRPDYVSTAKKGVAMPMMGGEDQYRTPSFLATDCVACRFRRPAAAAAGGGGGVELSQY